MSEKYSVFVTAAPGIPSLPFQPTDWMPVTRAGITYHIPATTFEPVASGYVYAIPQSGNTLTAIAGQGAFLLEPAGLLATLAVILPPNAVDGQVFIISTTQVISALTCLPAGGQMLIGGGPFILAGNGGVGFLFRGANNQWYRQF